MFETETVEVVWSSTFRQFAEPLLGREWDLHVGEDFPSQNSFVKVIVPDEEYAEEDEHGVDNFQRWLDGGEYLTDYPGSQPSCGRVMQWLYDNDHVPAGTYGIDIWW